MILKPAWLPLALQAIALVAICVLFHPAGTRLLWLALAYVFAVWTVAGWVTFGSYMATSLAPFSNVLSASFDASAHAMWFVPGLLALSTRSPFVVAIGLAVIVNAARLLALSRPPRGKSLTGRRIDHQDSPPPLFGYTPDPSPTLSSTAMAGGLILQLGLYALSARYPLPAAVSFAVVTALWVSASIGHGALKAKRAVASYAVPGALLTLLLTVSLTAVLMNLTVVLETPAAAAGVDDLAPKPGMTRRVLERLAHVPPAPEPAPPKPGEASPQPVVSKLVDPGPAIDEKTIDKKPPREKALNGIPGVVLRPLAVVARLPSLVMAGSRSRSASPAISVAFPFTGEYQLFRTSSGSLPNGAPVENGTPLERVYATTNGAPMQTVAVQAFDPPVDLTNCGRVTVEVVSAEDNLVLVMMQLVTGSGSEDGGSDLLGMKHAPQQTLEFQVPATAQPLLVRAIRISFQHPLVDSNKNVHIEVKELKFLRRGI